ncbi:MAG: hypothetical protein ACH350_05675 [Parachlamydiaceae bacterium]
MRRCKDSFFSYMFACHLLSILFVLFLTLSVVDLEATGWGKTEETVKSKGIVWTKVFIDLKGLSYSAFLPNYSGSAHNKKHIHLSGHVKEESGYLIETDHERGYKPPKSEKFFIKSIKTTNVGYTVKAVPPEKHGAKYAVDLIPNDKSQMIYWRYLATNDRLIKMGTDDRNKERRVYFFDSALIN